MSLQLVVSQENKLQIKIQIIQINLLVSFDSILQPQKNVKVNQKNIFASDFFKNYKSHVNFNITPLVQCSVFSGRLDKNKNE